MLVLHLTQSTEKYPVACPEMMLFNLFFEYEFIIKSILEKRQLKNELDIQVK